MAHKIHVDVLDKDGSVVSSCRDYACDDQTKPSNYSTNNGVLWKRWIEIENCIFSKEEIQKWCDFVTECGFKCYFDDSVEEMEIVSNVFDYATKKSTQSIEKRKCYKILLKREDYKNNIHLFIGNTIVRMISYILPLENIKGGEGFSYEEIVKNIFNIDLDIDPLEKLILGHYIDDFNTSYRGDHGLSRRITEKKCIKLQNSKKLQIKKGVNSTFDIILENVSYDNIMELTREKNFKEAYKLLKQK